MADRSLRIRLEAITSSYQTRMAAAQAQTRTFTQNLEKNALRNKQAFQTMGLAGIAFGGMIALGLKKSADAAMNFESSFAGVRKTVDGTEAQFARMARELRDLAPELGVNVNELNAIAEEAGQLGIQRENVVGFTATIAKLRETTDLVDAAPLAKLMNIMQTSQGEVDRLGSAVVALGNDGASTESQIVDMAQGIAGAGNIVGFSEAQVLSYSNALASVGIEAEAGGSSLTRVMLDIDEAVQTGGDKLEGFAEVAGMSASAFQTAFEQDAAGAIATFIEGLARVDESGGNVTGTLRELGFGEIRVRRALLGLAGAGDLLTESLDLGTQAFKDNNAMNTEFEKRMETADKKVDRAAAQLNDLAITIGSVLLPTIGAMAEVATTVFGGMASLIDGLPGPLKAVATGMSVVLSATLLLGGAALLLIPYLALVKRSMVELGLAAKGTSLGMGTLSLAMRAVPWVALVTGLAAMAKEASDAEAKIASLHAVIEDFGLESGKGARAAEETRDEIRRLGEASMAMDNTMGLVNQELAENEERLAALDRAYTIAKNPVDAWAVAMAAARARNEELADASYRTANQVKDTGKSIRAFVGMTKEEFADWRRETRGAINSVDDVLERFAGKTEVSAERILDAFSKQLSNMNDYEKNWRKLLRRGLPDSLTQQLQDMGIEGAGIVDALANSNDRDFEQIIRKWLRAEGVSKSVANAIIDDLNREKGKSKELRDEFNKHPDRVKVPFETPGLSAANEQVRTLLQNLGQMPDDVNIRATTSGLHHRDGIGMNAVSMANQAINAVPGFQMITSTYRSPAHNKAVGGSPTSYHMDSSNPAADIGGTNLGSIYAYLSRFPHRELINEGDHIHVADDGGYFRGPGLVRMGKGQEYFASGLRPAERVRPLPARGGGSQPNNLTFNIYADSTTDGNKLARIIRSEIEDNEGYRESRERVKR